MTRNRSSAVGQRWPGNLCYGVMVSDVVACFEPQPFVPVAVMVEGKAGPAELVYVAVNVPEPTPLAGAIGSPWSFESDQLVQLVQVTVTVDVTPTAIVDGFTLTDTVGSGFIGTFTVEEFEQPLALVTVTLIVTGPTEAVS